MTTVSSGKYRRSPGERRPSGQPIELTLVGGAYGGRMVARQPGDEAQGGRVVFVQGGLPGETVRGELTAEKKSFAEARAVRIAAPAAERTAPPCIYFGENGLNRGAVPSTNDLPGERGACGGCQYQHLEYAAQLELKRGIVADLMRRQARLGEVEVAPTIPSPEQWNYRNRVRWVIDDEGLPCYHQASSERLLPVHLCHIIQPVLVEVLAALSDPRWRLPMRTMVAEITARTAIPWKPLAGTAVPEQEIMLVLHPRPGARRRDLRLFASEIGTALPMINGIMMARTSHGGEQVAASGSLWGTTFLDTRFAEHRFRLAPLTFFRLTIRPQRFWSPVSWRPSAPSAGRACSTSTRALGRLRRPSRGRPSRCWRSRTIRWPSTTPTAPSSLTLWPTCTSYQAMPPPN